MAVRMRSALLAVLSVVSAGHAQTFYSQLKPCPAACTDPDPANWAVYSSTDILRTCNEPILLDFALRIPIDNPDGAVKIRACTTGDASTSTNALTGTAPTGGKDDVRVAKRDNSTLLDGQCSAPSAAVTTPSLARWGAVDGNAHDASVAIDQAVEYLKSSVTCETTIALSYFRGTIVGIYVGGKLESASFSSSAHDLSSDIASRGASTHMALQICDDSRTSDFIAGLAVSSSNDIARVQQMMLAWSKGDCVSTSDAAETAEGELTSLKTFSHTAAVKIRNAESMPLLRPRADCTTIRVDSGDSCGSLAQKCAISGANFEKYNSYKGDLCSTLSPGQPVCCSSGSLPDVRPKPKPNGECATYITKAGDYCAMLAASNGLTVKELEGFNKATWGWNGCDLVFQGVKICLSKGTVPLPAPVTGATCGPTKPGTLRPSSGQNMSDLNPCPLNVCCNIWGNCGTTSDFCTISKSQSGNPGTSAPGANGCVSSCGTDIVNNNQGPSSFSKIAYFESWNKKRPCLHMNADQIDSSYTHVHFSFADLTTDFGVSVAETEQFEKFKKLKGPKRILAFGGWAFSTEPATFQRLRDVVKSEHREAFANQVVAFLDKHGLDGVDFDWEYPGAPDIPDVPPGSEEDGPNYLEFLKLMKSKLNGRSLSIAAPASFWYLKAYPIGDISKVVDYIVYMTYDLHGQWDYANKWANPGCPQGNCLRSHVNMTETYNALSMITKAGVASNKIMVGLSSYGRSFKMTSASCRDAQCTFTGPQSGAKKGRCTDTAGYISNAEIDEIVNYGGVMKRWSDDTTDTDYLVYESTEWVAYLSNDRKNKRTDKYKGWNFAGVSDWAVDLQEYNDGLADAPSIPDGGYDVEDTDGLEPVTTESCDSTYDKLEDIPENVSSQCAAVYILQVLSKMLDNDLKHYNDIISGGYNGRFDTYAKAVVQAAPQSIRDFYLAHGNDYFTCVVPEASTCCGTCWRQWGQKAPECRYCDGLLCKNMGIEYHNRTEPCPPDYSQMGCTPGKNCGGTTIYWTLQKDKEDDFYAALEADTGIEKGDTTITAINHQPNPVQCHTYPKCFSNGWDFGIPGVARGYGTDDVSNPKDIISKYLESTADFRKDLITAAASAKGGARNAWSNADMVDAVSIPVLMIHEAVEAMQKVDDTAKEIEQEERKQMILMFVTAFLFLIPIGGEAIGAISGFANIGRIISLAGEAAMVADDIYTVTQDASQAPFLIFGYILSVGSLVDAVKIGKAADIRRHMTDGEIAKLGDNIGNSMGKIGTIMAKACKR